MYDLNGIHYEHAIASVHDRKHHYVDYISEFYKKDEFLASYNFSL